MVSDKGEILQGGWSSGAVGNLFGIPVIETPLVGSGKVYLVGGGSLAGYDSVEDMLMYVEPEASIKGYVQRKANALRRELGLPTVNYKAEHVERTTGIRATQREIIAETRLGMVMEKLWPFISW